MIGHRYPSPKFSEENLVLVFDGQGTSNPSKASSRAYAKLHGVTYSDIEKLGTEFEGYDDGSIPVTHYFIHDE